MADDVTARMIIACESADAQQQINGVRNGVKGLTDERRRDLEVAQAKARLEIAEYKSMQEAQKAYNAEIAAEGAAKRLAFQQRKGDTQAIDEAEKAYDKLKQKALEAANAEAQANLSAYDAKVKLDTLTATTDATGKTVSKYTTKVILAKAASRAFGIGIGNGINPAMAQMGIIAAGAMSALKIVNHLLNKQTQDIKDGLEDRQIYNQSTKEAGERLKELAEKQNSAMSSLIELNKSETLTHEQRFEQSKLLKQLGLDYKALGIEIDTTTGKMKGLEEAQGKLNRQQIEKEKRNVAAQLKQIESDIEMNQQIIDSATIGSYITSKGDSYKDAKEAAKEINRLRTESAKLNARRAELYRMTPEKDAADLAEARRKDAEDKAAKEAKKKADKAAEKQAKKQQSILDQYNKQNNAMDVKLRMQNLINQGQEREAKILELQNKYREAGYSDAQAQTLLAKEMQYYDTEQAKKAQKKTGKTDNKGFNSAISMFNKANSFRQTSQSAVNADSLEGLRLQSRRMGGDSGKELLTNAKNQLNVLKELRNDIHLMRTNGTSLTLKAV